MESQLRPMPTVEELVKVFKDNDWKPLSCTDGVKPVNVLKGDCCAMPALIKIAGDEYFEECFCGDPSDRNKAYDMIEFLYGKTARETVWEGFDEYRPGKPAGPAMSAPTWSALGWNLHKALLESEVSVNPLAHEQTR
jgi:hypothetical protein